MADVADYTVIKDAPFTLSRADVPNADSHIHFEFGLNDDTIIKQRSILSFMVSWSKNATLTVTINGGTPVFVRDLGSTDIDRCYQEVCSPDILHASHEAGQRNGFRFEVSGPGGAGASCKISDVVIWTQQKAT